jgi:hypothetical protein
MRAMVEVFAALTRFLEQAAITTALQKVDWKKCPYKEPDRNVKPLLVMDARYVYNSMSCALSC